MISFRMLPVTALSEALPVEQVILEKTASGLIIPSYQYKVTGLLLTHSDKCVKIFESIKRLCTAEYSCLA